MPYDTSQPADQLPLRLQGTVTLGQRQLGNPVTVWYVVTQGNEVERGKTVTGVQGMVAWQWLPTSGLSNFLLFQVRVTVV